MCALVAPSPRTPDPSLGSRRYLSEEIEVKGDDSSSGDLSHFETQRVHEKEPRERLGGRQKVGTDTYPTGRIYQT